jgi:Protein of unknown function (DUF3754)
LCFALQALERRNIHIKRFEEIPIADTELIFPDKTIFLKPLTILQLAVTLIGGLVAAFATLWGVRASWTQASTSSQCAGMCVPAVNTKLAGLMRSAMVTQSKVSMSLVGSIIVLLAGRASQVGFG